VPGSDLRFIADYQHPSKARSLGKLNVLAGLKTRSPD
jgi:hypothetical protein